MMQHTSSPLVKEIGGNCRVAWSPLKGRPGYAVLGSKQGGGGFNDYGGTLQLVSLDMQNAGTTMPVVRELKTRCACSGLRGVVRVWVWAWGGGACAVGLLCVLWECVACHSYSQLDAPHAFAPPPRSARFSSLDWGRVSQHKGARPMGLVAGGMSSGVVNIWDPALMQEGKEETLVTRIEKSRGSITSLQFNSLPQSQHLFATGSRCVCAHSWDCGADGWRRSTPPPTPCWGSEVWLHGHVHWCH